MRIQHIAQAAFLTISGTTPNFGQAQVDMQKYLGRSFDPLDDLQISNALVQSIGMLAPNPEPFDLDPDPGLVDPLFKVTYPVYTDGYLVSGAVHGTMAYGFTINLGSLIGTSFIQRGVSCSMPIYGYEFNYITRRDEWKIRYNLECNNTWSIPGSINNYYFIKFVYHHGANSCTSWNSAISYAEGNTRQAALVNTYGPRNVIEGGNFTCWTGPYSPQSFGGLQGYADQVYGGTRLDASRHVGLLPMGDSYLEQVQFYGASYSLTQTTIQFSQFFSSLPESRKVDIKLVGIGLADYECDFVEGTTSYQNLSVNKHTQLTYRTTFIAMSELDQDFDGDIQVFRSSMTNAASSFISPWPNVSVNQPQLTTGMHAILSAVIN